MHYTVNDRYILDHNLIPMLYANSYTLYMKILLLLLLSTYLFAGSLESFSKSKKELRKIYQGHQITFYADCKYNYKDKKNMIDRDSCGYKPRNERTKKGKSNQRARRIEWEHVMPAENFGRHFSCWRDGDSKCINKKGKAFKGRKCCEKVSKQYRTIQADMMNLVPAIGELNADRKNFRYGADEPRVGQYGKVPFQVDFKQKRAYIKPSKRGDVARIYLYMSETYNLPLSKQERKIMEVWNKQDPVDEWEKSRVKRIEQYTFK